MKRLVMLMLTAAVAAVAALKRIKLSEIGEDPKARSARNGSSSRLNAPASRLFAGVGKVHEAGPRFAWASVSELNGYFWLAPTSEEDEDRLHVRWEDGGQSVAFSLNKVWKSVQMRVPKGYALVMDVDVEDHPDVGTALRIHYETGRLEQIQPRRAAPQPQAKPETKA